MGSQNCCYRNMFGHLGRFETMIVCPEIKQKQPQDRKTIFETLSLLVAKILLPVARQAQTKLETFFNFSFHFSRQNPTKDGRKGTGQKCYKLLHMVVKFYDVL